MNDAVLYRVLIRQQVNVDNLTEYDAQNLYETKQEANGCTIAFEQFSLLVRELHYIDSFCNFWIQYQMQGQSTRNLNIEDSKAVTELILIPVLLIGHNGGHHAYKHKDNNQLNTKC